MTALIIVLNWRNPVRHASRWVFGLLAVALVAAVPAVPATADAKPQPTLTATCQAPGDTTATWSGYHPDQILFVWAEPINGNQFGQSSFTLKGKVSQFTTPTVYDNPDYAGLLPNMVIVYLLRRGNVLTYDFFGCS